MSGGPSSSQTEESGQPAWRHFLMAGLIAALLIPVLFVPTFHLIEARLYDIMSVTAPPPPPNGAVVVAIDEPSLSDIRHRWPGPRDLHARLS